MVKSFISNKVEIRESKIHQKGVFAKHPIKKGEIVSIKGGHILTKEDIFSTGVINCYMPIDDNYFLGARNAEEENNVKLYINHSCNPNCGIRGEITFVTMKDIEIGEELTIDYAFLDNEEYEFQCSCGEKECRATVTGKDWKIKSLQDKYFDYFTTYLKKKINNNTYSSNHDILDNILEKKITYQNMNLMVKNIAKDKKYFNEVLDLVYKEWGNNNFDFWHSWMNNSMFENDIPMTFLVFCDNEFVGTFSLWRCDLQSRQDLFPWLGGIVVKEDWRRKGIGLFMQMKAKEILKILGYRRAYLFTEMTGYYEKTGWCFLDNGKDALNVIIKFLEG